MKSFLFFFVFQWCLFNGIGLIILMPIRYIISLVLWLLFLLKDNLCVSFIFQFLKCTKSMGNNGWQLCASVCIQIKAFWLYGCRWILQVHQKYRKSCLPFLNFKYNFLPHLGSKNTLAKYIREPMEIFSGPIPAMLSFRVDLICGNWWYNATGIKVWRQIWHESHDFTTLTFSYKWYPRGRSGLKEQTWKIFK